MGIFNRLSEDELELINFGKDILVELVSADLEMSSKPTPETALEMIRIGNSLAEQVVTKKHVVTNLSIHHPKHFRELQACCSQIRSFRDNAIQYLDYEDAKDSQSKSEVQIEWELKVIQRLCTVKPITFYNGDMGFRGNTISTIPIRDDWKLLRDEFAETGKLSMYTWKKVRSRLEKACRDNKVRWEYGDGSQKVIL